MYCRKHLLLALDCSTYMAAADGVDGAAAAREYSKRKVPAAPCGRYGATAVVYQQQMWLFGGTDGGFSKKGQDKSKAGKGAGIAMPFAAVSAFSWHPHPCSLLQ